MISTLYIQWRQSKGGSDCESRWLLFHQRWFHGFHSTMPQLRCRKFQKRKGRKFSQANVWCKWVDPIASCEFSPQSPLQCVRPWSEETGCPGACKRLSCHSIPLYVMWYCCRPKHQGSANCTIPPIYSCCIRHLLRQIPYSNINPGKTQTK